MPFAKARALVVAVVAQLAGAPEASMAQTFYEVEKLVAEEEPVAGLEPLYMIYSHFDFSEGADVAFAAAAQATGEFLIGHGDGASFEAIAREGDPVPGFPSLPHLSFVWAPRFGAAGNVFWGGGWQPVGGQSRGMFVRSGGVHSPLVMPGQAAPGGGSFELAEPIDANESNELVFWGSISEVGSGSWIRGLFLASSSGIEQVARSGDAAPAPLTGTFADLASRPVLSANGNVLFWAELLGGAVPHALLRRSPGGAIEKLLAPGDPVQTPVGGHFLGLWQFLATNPAGDLVFYAEALEAGATSRHFGVYVVGSQGQRRIVRDGDPIPGLIGEHFLGLTGSDPFAIGPNGDVAILARTESWEGVLVARGDTLQLVAGKGQAVPGMPGRQFQWFNEVHLNAAGQVAFSAAVTGSYGVFLATPLPPEVPLAPAWALAALGLAIVAGGWRRLARR